MDTREPAGGHGDFDPRPLQALEQDLARRVEARDQDFALASWEFDAAASSGRASRARLLRLAARGALAAGVFGAVAGAIALPDLARRDPSDTAARPATTAFAPGGDSRLAALTEPTPDPFPPSTPAPEDQPAPDGPEAPDRPGEPAAPEAAAPVPTAKPAAAAPPPASAPAPVIVASRPRPGPPPSVAVATLDPPRARLATPGAGFDCGRPLSRAEDMVCADPELAARDRALGHALRGARAAGVPEWRLRRQHARWIRARDEAADAAPWALPEIYESRIDELYAEAQAAEAGQP